jgi:hypothetical protein
MGKTGGVDKLYAEANQAATESISAVSHDDERLHVSLLIFVSALCVSLDSCESCVYLC